MNRSVGDLVSLVLLVLPWTGYRGSHIKKHHGPGFCTETGDDDAAFLHWLGIRSGRSRAQLWAALLRGLVSPWTHLLYLASRLRANLISAGTTRSFLTAAYLATLAVIGWAVGYATLIVAWVLPLTILYQASSIVGWAGEHLWFQPKSSDQSTWHRDATHARFMGEPYPTSAGVLARIRWWTHLLVLHVPCRFLCVPGDLPAHDWHHRYPGRREWPIGIYARQQDIERGEIFPHETWGLIGAIDRVFKAISSCDPVQTTHAKTSPGELMLGM